MTLLAAGVEVYKGSRWVGHANISTTDSLHAHLYPGHQSVHLPKLATYGRGQA